MRNKYIQLTIIFVVAYVLRVLYLPQGALTFGYDQARDAFISQQILAGDFKILGPPSSAPGLYHGVFYYYFLAPAYMFGKNPLFAAYWTAFFNALTVFIVYYLAKILSKSHLAGLVSALLFAVSFESSQYAVWLSNPTLGVWTVPLFYVGLWQWLKNKKNWGAPLAAIALGLSIQSEIFLAYHGVPLFIWLWVERTRLKLKDVRNFIVFFVISLSSMILVELKFGFQSIKGVMHLASSQDALVQSKKFGDIVLLYLNQIGKTFADNLFPLNLGYGAFIGIAFVIYLFVNWDRKKKGISWQPFLLTYVLSHLSVVSVGGTSTPFLLVGIGSGVSVMGGIIIANLIKNKNKLTYILLLLIILGNVLMILQENKKGQTIFSIQKDMLLSKQLSAIDYTYEISSGEAFSINTVTSPLWINTVWSYLYDWYGYENYGYMPYWHGRDQVGRLGKELLPQVNEDINNYYLIVEPLAGIPRRFYDDTLASEDALYGEVLKTQNFGEIIVQTREINE